MVKDAVSPEDRPLIDGFPWPEGLPVALINVEGAEASADGTSIAYSVV
jgi:hypothetical protein